MRAIGSLLAISLTAMWSVGLATEREISQVVFQAVDRNGKAVAGLGTHDLEIIQRERIYSPESLRFGAGPLDLMLVLDIDPRTADVTRDLAQGARLACNELEGDDRIGLITFASKPKIRFELIGKESGPARLIERGVSSSSSSGLIKLFDALEVAVNLFATARDANRRRAIVVIANHLDAGSRVQPQQIQLSARNKSVAIFGASIVCGAVPRPLTGAPPSRCESAEAALAPVAQFTGGRFKVAEPSGYLLRQLFEQVRSRYVATYVADDHSQSAIDVRLSERGKAAFPGVLIRGVQ